MTAPPVTLVPQGWQDISSAPKDGSPVLLWEPGETLRHDGIVITGTYTHFDEPPPEGYHSGWFDDVQGHYEIHPTHWMPLPDPPLPSLVPDPEEDTK